MPHDPSIASPKPERRTIAGLHYVRAAATLMVAIYHADVTNALGKYFGHRAFHGFFTPVAGEIDLFFLMSGVIMVVATHDRKTKLPRIDAAEFWWRRAIRLLPLLWLAVLLSSILIFLVHPADFVIGPTLRGLFLWPVGEVIPFTAWTIRYEVMFYIVFGMFFLLWPKLIFLAVAWFTAPLALALVGQAPICEDGEFFHFFFSPYNMEFGAGVAVGMIYLRSPQFLKFDYSLGVIIALVLSIRCGLWLYPGPAMSAYSTFHVFLLMAPCLLIVSFALWTEPSRTFKPMIFLGDASYSIFLFHPVAVSPVLILLKKAAPSLNPDISFALAAIAGIGFGCAIHVLIEKPLIKHANMKLHSLPGVPDRAVAQAG